MSNEDLSNEEIKDLFYFPNEKILCWVMGYDYSTNLVSTIVKHLQDDSLQFAKIVNEITYDNIRTDVIYQGRKYKYMRYFYIKTDICPKEAYIVQNNNWTMWKWLTD